MASQSSGARSDGNQNCSLRTAFASVASFKRRMRSMAIIVVLAHNRLPAFQKTTTCCIVAAAGRFENKSFPQPSRRGAVEITRLLRRQRVCQRKQTQASRCYECDPPTFSCLLTKLRVAECALFPERILRCGLVQITDSPILPSRKQSLPA
jgi:hypothetical protein